ncbi:MAG TPA: AAA family ATPase [Thermoleophilaceae bacterium]|nr:AAA family ATPase [Thermoleophilaceae bacterium]
MPATEHGLLGRESELAVLDRLIGDAARGRGRVVALRGEPGIGKTRLAREALSRCGRRGFELRAAAAEEMEQRRPFGVVSDALGVDRAHDRERAEIRALLRGGGMAGGGVLAESAVLESRVAELVLEHVEGLCARHRVALLLEDLHWADPSSLLALHRIARAAGELGLLVICTLRPYPERRELRALLASLERLGATRLELEALDAGAVGALAERVAGAPPSAALRRRLEAVGGNPLFVIELVAALGAQGQLERAPDGLAQARGDGLPPSLRLTILHRLSALPERTLEALRAASALGSRVAVSELAVALGRPVAELADALGPALSARALVEAGDRLAFRHELLREALYDDVPLAVRRALHRELGARLIAAGAPVERVAEHMLLGAEPGDREAIDWLRRAGRQAAPRAPVVAAELLERALALTPSDAPSYDEVRAELVEPLVWSGRGADVEALCREALGRAGGAERENHFRLGLARGLQTEGRLLEAHAEFERLARSPSLAEPARALVAAYAANLGAFLGAEEAAEGAAAVLKAAGDGPAGVIARIALAATALFSGHSDVALERLDRLARAGAGESLPVLLQRALTLLDLDRLEEARETIGAADRAVLGAPAGLALCHATLVSIDYHAGRLGRAVAEHEAAVELARQTGQRWLVASYALRAAIAVHQGALEEAERPLAEAEAQRAELGPQLGAALVPLARARLGEARGELEAAAAATAEWWQLARRFGLRSHLAWFAPPMVGIALAAGERALAEAMSAAAGAVAAALPIPSRRGCALHCRGLVEDDPKRLLEAVAVLRDSGRPLQLGLALESAACALARAGRDGEARALGAEALGLYRQGGAAGDADRARARLRAAGLRLGARGSRGRPRSGWESLTEAELGVARLVAEGRSNPEIAARLYLTRRTVRAHVSSALRKLHLSSRVELAAEAIRRGL